MPGPALPVVIAATIGKAALKKLLKPKKKPPKTKKGRVCKSCKQKVKCFKKPDKADPAEFQRQMQMQEDAINNTNPGDLEKAIKAFKKHGRPSDGAARALVDRI